MKNSLYIVAALLLISWGIMFFGYKASMIVNLIFVLAVLILAARYFFYNAQVK